MLRSPAPSQAKSVVTYDTVRDIGLALPGVEEGMSYGTRALKVKGKLLARLRDDPDILVIRTDPIERDHRMKTNPGAFFITDHYRDYPWMLVRLSRVTAADLRDLMEQAWRRVASKRLVARHA